MFGWAMLVGLSVVNVLWWMRHVKHYRQDDRVLRGKDADIFLKGMSSAVLTPERRRWLESVAEESRQAEKRGKHNSGKHAG